MPNRVLERARSFLPIIPLAFLTATAQEPQAHDPVDDPGLPESFQRVLPRGRIASVDDPQFVSAEEAEISDDAWVLGITLGGQARAYSLNLLNHHEIVNDLVGGRAIAAVW